MIPQRKKSSAPEAIRLNGQALMKLAPARTAVMGLLVYIGMVIIAPVVIMVEPGVPALLYAGAGYMALFSGVFLHHLVSPSPFAAPVITIQPIAPTTWRMAILLSGGAIAVRLFDRFVLRGVPIGEGADAVRNQLMNTEASPLSALGAALYPSCYAVLILFYCLPKRHRTTSAMVISYVLFLYPTMEAMMQNSRSLIIVSVALVLQARSVLIGSFAFLKSRVVQIGAGVGGMVGFFSVFVARLEDAGREFLASAQESGYAFTVQPNDTMMDLMMNNYGLLTTMAAAFLHVTQYYTHSFFEFFFIYDSLPELHSWGGFNFFHIYKFVGMVTGWTAMTDRAMTAEIRQGIFATMFVPMWVDFGWLMPAVMFVFGYIAAWLWKLSLAYPQQWFPLYSYIVVVIFLIPVTSFFFAAQGFYTISALTATSLMVGFLERRRARARVKHFLDPIALDEERR